MILESKFNLADKVYFIKDNKVAQGTIGTLYIEARMCGFIQARYFVIDAWINEENLHSSRKELAAAIVGEDLDDH